ncbi:MAG: AraC family transcriptional regulator [Clostridia bacterium]|nr:AraC family transcriptional regulator [Clostridia bacterium]
MNVKELAEKIGLNIVAGQDGVEKEVAGCYIGDLMSLAMARVEEGNVWITIQTNINVVAVAALKEAACVILADGCVLDENAAQKADDEGIPVLVSDKSAYELALQHGELKI